MPRVVILASKVTLCQRWCGTRPMARSPRGARARSRVKRRRRGRLIQEDEALRGDGGERIPPPLPRRLVALSGDQGLFLSGNPQPRQRPRHGGGTDGHALGGGPVRTVLGQRGVGVRPDLLAQRRFSGRINPPLPPWSRPRGHVPRLPPTLLPAADRPIGDAKGAGGLRACQPSVQGPQQAVAKVGRVLFHPCRIAPRTTPVQLALADGTGRDAALSSITRNDRRTVSTRPHRDRAAHAASRDAVALHLASSAPTRLPFLPDESRDHVFPCAQRERSQGRFAVRQADRLLLGQLAFPAEVGGAQLVRRRRSHRLRDSAETGQADAKRHSMFQQRAGGRGSDKESGGIR